VTRKERQALADEVPFWWHSVDLGEGAFSRGRKSRGLLAEELEALRLPSLDQKSVLDIGAFDGYFSFAAEEAGAARVVALDWFAWGRNRAFGRAEQLDRLDMEGLPGRRGFDLAHRLRGSSVEPVVADFMDIDLEALGTFDVVLFLGVLYHQTDPLGALRRLRAVARELAVIETHAVLIPGFEGRPLWEHYPDKLREDSTVSWGPNARGLLEACRVAGFARAEMACAPRVPTPAGNGVVHYRLIVHAWTEAPAGAGPDPAAAERDVVDRVGSLSWKLARPLRSLRWRLRR
jgi:tRNA (mo5U34)-methyltransferase